MVTAAEALFLNHLGAASVSSIETDDSVAEGECMLTMAMVDTANREEDSDDRGPTGGRTTTPSSPPSGVSAAVLMQKLAAGERLSTTEELQLERATSRRARHNETPLSRQASFNKKTQQGQQVVQITNRRSSEVQREDLAAALCAMSSARQRRQRQHEQQVTSSAAAAAAAVAAATSAAIAAVVALGDTVDCNEQQCDRESGAAEAFGDCVDALRRSSDALSRYMISLLDGPPCLPDVLEPETSVQLLQQGHDATRKPHVSNIFDRNRFCCSASRLTRRSKAD